MTAIRSPQEQAAALGRAVTARVSRLDGVAHLAPGWRDLVAQLPGGAAALSHHPRSAGAYRGEGVEVRFGEAGPGVTVALVLAWPHPVPAVCEAVQAAVATAAAEVIGTQACHVHVAVRDVDFGGGIPA